MAETWTTPEDVLARWLGGGEPELTDPKLQVFIEDAEDAILRVYPRIQERIDSNKLPLNRVKRVVSLVVTRAYKGGYSPLASYSRATGPFSESGTYDANAKKNISLTAEDIRELAPTDGVYGIFTTSRTPAPRSTGGWVVLE
jgi:hypothetical protein